MDFWDLTKLLFRRWYLTVPLLLLSLGAAIWVGKTVKPDYISTSYVQLIPPTAATIQADPGVPVKKDTGPRNPWLELGLTSLSRAGTLTVQDKNQLEQLHASGLSDNVVVTADNQSPVITIAVVAKSETQATATSNEVYKRLTTNILNLQADYGAKKESFVTVRRLDRGDNIEEANSKVKRALVAVAGVGVLLSVAITIGTDALIRLRRRRKDEGAEVAAETGPATGSVGMAAGGSVIAGASGGMQAKGRIHGQAKRTPVNDTKTPARNSPGEKTVVISPAAAQEDIGATIVIPLQTSNGRRQSSSGGPESQESGRK